MARGKRPVDPSSAKLYDLVNGIFSLRQCAGLVRCYGHAPQTAMVSGQIHGSTSAIKRHHPEYFLDTLLCRTGVSIGARLLPNPSKAEKEFVKVGKQLSRVDRRKPDTLRCCSM